MLEHEFQDLSYEERYKKRLELSKHIAEEFFAWAKSINALPKSLIGKAIGYTLSQQPYLENVFLDGRLELSNNIAERSIKPFVIGRKNWLFANSPKGANASAIIYSIIETAKGNHLKVYDYLNFLFETLPNSSFSMIDPLLPWSVNM